MELTLILKKYILEINRNGYNRLQPLNNRSEYT